MTYPPFDPAVNAEYMPSRRVPGAQRLFDAWARDSAAVREKHPPRELAYGPAQHEKMDVFTPAHPRGTVLFIHGGYWQAFYKDHFSYLAAPLLLADFCVAVMSYDLVPGVTLAHIVQQTRQATAYAFRHLPGPLCVAGHSAGGHLAAMMHATDWAAHGFPTVDMAGGIGISGLYDLAPLRHTELQPDLQLGDDDLQTLSPIHLKPRQSSPFLVAVGELESGAFQAQSRALTAAWPGVATPVVIQPGRHHFNAPDDLLQLTRALLS